MVLGEGNQGGAAGINELAKRNNELVASRRRRAPGEVADEVLDVPQLHELRLRPPPQLLPLHLAEGNHVLSSSADDLSPIKKVSVCDDYGSLEMETKTRKTTCL